jgi:hypothetical protein
MRKDIITRAAHACNVTVRHFLWLACCYCNMSQEEFEKIVSAHSMKRKLPQDIIDYAKGVLLARTGTAS